MNWLLPAVLIFLLFAALDGHRRGFIKKSVGIVSLALTLFLTSAAAPYMTEFLREKTALRNVLQRGIISAKNDVFEMMEMIGMEKMLSGYLADLLLQAAAFLITLLFVGVLVQGLALSLGLAAKLPVLHGINKMAGLVLGLGEGVLLVWIFFFVVTVCAATETGGELLLMIAESDVLSWLYRRNLLFLFLAL